MKAAQIFGSLGRVIDPMVEATYQAGSRGLLGRFNAWNFRRIDSLETQKALYVLKKELPSFTSAPFLEQASKDYNAVVHGITDGQLSTVVKPRVTEQCMSVIRRGVAEGVVESQGSRQGARIIRQLEPPSLVRTRLVYAEPELLRMARAPSDVNKPDFVQCTVRFASLIQPIATLVPPVANALVKGNFGPINAPGADLGDTAGIDSGVAISAAHRQAHEEFKSLGEWMPVEDPGTGLTYWYNPQTGVSQWKKPPAAQMVIRKPFRIDQAGFKREPDAEAAAAVGFPFPFMRVWHYVVFERKTRGKDVAAEKWRIARL